MDSRDWRATWGSHGVHGVPKSWTRLSNLARMYLYMFLSTRTSFPAPNFSSPLGCYRTLVLKHTHTHAHTHTHTHTHTHLNDLFYRAVVIIYLFVFLATLGRNVGSQFPNQIIPAPPALRGWNLNHWTGREVPETSIKCSQMFFKEE